MKKNVRILFLGYDKVAELLIQKGADVNIVGDYGSTALIWAAENGKLVKLLFQKLLHTLV